MKKSTLIVSLLLVAVVCGVVIAVAMLTTSLLPQKAGSSPSFQAAAVVSSTQAATARPGTLTQQQIETRAIATAQEMGLQGMPTRVRSKLTTEGDFDRRLSPDVHPKDPNVPMWLVVLKGDVEWTGSSGFPKSNVKAGAMWELLEPNGHIMGWGGLFHDTDIDLDGPPVEVYPITPQVITNK